MNEDIQNQISILEKKTKDFDDLILNHGHDNISSKRNTRTPIIITINLSLATDMINKNIFIADRGYIIRQVQEVHTTAETTAATLTLDIKSCTGTTAPASGTSILSSNLNMKGTANTVVTGALSTNKIAKGDRLALNFSAVATELAGLVLILVLETIK